MGKKKRILSSIIVFVIAIVSIYGATRFLELKDSRMRYASFLTEDVDADVLFIGSSHVRHSFFPMELWEDYGITSYNVAGNGNTLPVTYWTFVNALDYQTPKLVVLDVFDMWPGRVCGQNWGQVHVAFDYLPISVNKIKMVMDLFDDPTLTDEHGNNLYEKRWELVWNLGEYHSRWNDLREEDFYGTKKIEQISASWKGAGPLYGIADREVAIYPEDFSDVEYDELAKEYLIRTIELCKEKGIELVLINTSYDVEPESKLFADSAYDIAQDYGLPYLDFTKENIINFEADLFSPGHNTHVNLSGAERMTKYIGEYLNSHYDLEDHRTDEKCSYWWKDYSAYCESKEVNLIQQNNIQLYLAALTDEDYDVCFEINDFTILDENHNRALIENLGVDFESNPEANYIVVDNGVDDIAVVDVESNTEYIREPACVYYEKHDSFDDMPVDTRIRITVTRNSDGGVIDIKEF